MPAAGLCAAGDELVLEAVSLPLEQPPCVTATSATATTTVAIRNLFVPREPRGDLLFVGPRMLVTHPF
jgi:hypothetical protein